MKRIAGIVALPAIGGVAGWFGKSIMPPPEPPLHRVEQACIDT